MMTVPGSWLRSALARVGAQEDLNFLLTNRLPRRLATRFMGWFSRIEQPWVRDLSIATWRLFCDVDLRDAAVEARIVDGRALDGDEPIVVRVALGLAIGDRLFERRAHIGAGKAGKGRAIAGPEGLEDHAIGGLRAFEEAGDIEAAIGGDDRANAAGRALFEGEAGRIGPGRGGTRPRRRRLRRRSRLWPRHRLLLMARALTEDGVQAKPHEQSDHGQQHDSDGQQRSP